MKTFFRSVCVSVLIALPSQVSAATPDHLHRRVAQLRCEDFLSGTAPVEPGVAPAAPSLLKTTGRWIMGEWEAVGEHREARRAVAAHAEQQKTYLEELATLGIKRDHALDQWLERARRLGIHLEASLRPVAAALNDKVVGLLREAVTVPQIEAIGRAAETLAQDIALESEELRQQRELRLAEERRQRREAEHRFDVGTAYNESRVLMALKSVAPDLATSADLPSRMRRILV